MWLVKTFGIALPLAWGASWLLPLQPEESEKRPHSPPPNQPCLNPAPLISKARPLTVVMGKPILVQKAEGEPTKARMRPCRLPL